jgi:hypothetical protein
MSKDEQTAREQAVAAKYETAHDLARKLLQLPDHRIVVTSAVFDMPGCFHALPVILTLFMGTDGTPRFKASPAYMGERARTRAFFEIVANITPLYAIVNEIWVSEYKGREIPENAPPPSEDPQRTEAVAVTLVLRGKTIYQDRLRYTRKDGINTVGKWESADDPNFIGIHAVPEGSVFPPSP